jgi:short subunit dehydrogenase-like uncharacterized protein
MPSNTRISAPYEDDGKRLPRVSFATFVATSIAIPVVGITVLPLSILYQCGSVAFRRMNSIVHRSTASGQRLNRLDSGYLVDESQIIPLAKRQYDIVILGATGFTGYLAARHIVKTYGNKIRWAIAGRSPEKLQSVIQRLSQEVEGAGTTTALKIDTIICDTSVPSTLPNLVANTRVVATTAGPYSLYGTSVVEFCAKFGTHYVDITGEVDWVKAMLCEYQETAQKNRCQNHTVLWSRVRTRMIWIPNGPKADLRIAHGYTFYFIFSSVPWDLSLMKMQEELQDRFDDNVQSVMFWDEFRSDAPGGTYATILNAISGNTIKAPKMKFDPFLQLPDGSKSEFVCNSDFRSLLPAPSTSPWESPSSKRWSAPFVMAVVNFQVARWSHALRCKGSKTLKYSEVAVHPDFPTAFTNVAFLAMFGTMLLNPITATILMKFVIPKPGDGPSMEQMENKSKFFFFLFMAVSWSKISSFTDEMVVSQISSVSEEKRSVKKEIVWNRFFISPKMRVVWKLRA